MHVQKIFGACDFKHLLMQCTGWVHGYHNIIPQKPMTLTFVTESLTLIDGIFSLPAAIIFAKL